MDSMPRPQASSLAVIPVLLAGGSGTRLWPLSREQYPKQFLSFLGQQSLFQNTARVHFNQYTEEKGRFGRRLIYGGHIISIARALSFNGLANAVRVAAINGGRHVAPLFAGGTVFAWTEVLGASELPGRSDVGALRLRTVATKDRPCADFPYKNGEEYDPAVLLDLDYWVLIPR